MIVAIAADNRTIDSNIAMQFGRCPFYCLLNTNNGSSLFIENPALAYSQKVGCEAAEFLIKQQVEIVVAGQFGTSVINFFRQSNIQLVIAKLPKTVAEVVEQLSAISLIY